MLIQRGELNLKFDNRTYEDIERINQWQAVFNQHFKSEGLTMFDFHKFIVGHLLIKEALDSEKRKTKLSVDGTDLTEEELELAIDFIRKIRNGST